MFKIFSAIFFQRSPADLSLEQDRQDKQEENYSFVYGQNQPTLQDSDQTTIDSDTDFVSQFEEVSKANSQGQDDTTQHQTHSETENNFLSKEDEDS